MSDEIEYKAWPYREATKVLDRLAREQKAGTHREREILLQTGFGPSGMPHIGTFSEVARTNWVRQALRQLQERPVTLYVFSDDMDGMRGVPLDMPNVEGLIEDLGKPLCQVRDPFGEHESFAAHMNAKLQEFLDSFGFEYVFKSSREQYESGVFNEGLKKIVDHYDEVVAVVTADLREETAATWSPFKPTCQSCGRNTTTRVVGVDREAYTVDYICDGSFNAKVLTWEERERSKRKQASKDAPVYYQGSHKVRGCEHSGTIPVTDGHLKVGWKVDWALRWFAFGVDYEMYGKDLIEAAHASSPLVKILGGEPPEQMVYEWFNDEHGQSISKTKGNGLTIDEWLTYGPLESLAWYVYQNPSKSKKLHRGLIPTSTDKFLEDRARFGREQDEGERVNNPVWFVEQARWARDEPVGYASDVTFGLLLNLVNVLNTEDRELIWNYIASYDATARQTNEALLDAMIDCALNYYRDFVAPTKQFKAPAPEMQAPMAQFTQFLKGYKGDSAEELQAACYLAGKENGVKLGAWFKTLYQLLLGQTQGPRIGTFVQLYGVSETLELIEQQLAEVGESAPQAQ